MGAVTCGGINNPTVQHGRQNVFDLIWPDEGDGYSVTHGVGGMDAG